MKVKDVQHHLKEFLNRRWFYRCRSCLMVGDQSWPVPAVDQPTYFVGDTGTAGRSWMEYLACPACDREVHRWAELEAAHRLGGMEAAAAMLGPYRWAEGRWR